MRTIVFTKPFGPLGVAGLVAELARLRDHGATGADVVVRAGQTVSPDQPGRLATLAHGLAANGLALDVVTTDLLEPDAAADRLLGACAAAGARLVRTGFYRYDPALGHRRCGESARTRLAGLATLAARHGARLAVQLHHGTIHTSAAHARLLLDGLDHEVLVYADPGNQLKEGSEDWRLCLDVLDERLACVGVKNAAWRHTSAGWECGWVPLRDGLVRWPATLAELLARGYSGPLSVHVHYPTVDVPGTLRAELTQLSKALSEARSMVGD